MSTEPPAPPENTSTPATEPDLEPLPQATPLRQAFIIGIVTASILLFCTLVGVIYFKWQPEPTAELLVPPGNVWLDGVVILARGNGEKDLELSLEAKNNYGGRIILTPGQYVIQMKLKGVVIWTDRLPVKDSVNQRFQIPLLDAEHRDAFEKIIPDAELQSKDKLPK